MSNKEAAVIESKKSSSIVFGVHAFDAMDRGQWDRLFRESRSCNLFYDYEIIEAAQSIWKQYRSLEVVTGHRDGELVALQPVRFRPGPMAKALELLRLPTADSNEPLVSPGQWEDTGTGLLDFVSSGFRPDIIIAKSISENWRAALTSCFATFRPAVKRVRTAPVLYLPSSVEGYWASLKSDARNQLKRKLRKAGTAGIGFRVLESGESASPALSKALDDLTRLHRLRFDSMHRASFFVTNEFQQFHRALCQRSGGATVTVTFTEAVRQGKVIGSIYGMRTDQVYIYLMIGFDPEFSQYSVGNLLIYKTIEHLIAHGTRMFDFKCGKEAYKRRWTTHYYENFDVNFCLGSRGRVFDTAVDWLDGVNHARKLSGKLFTRVRKAAGIPKKRIGTIKSTGCATP